MMQIRNVHTRTLDCPPERAGALLELLPGRDSPVWPVDHWPPMILDRPLGVGADGGHGPIRYRCTAYEPGRMVEFTFSDRSILPGGTHTLFVEDGLREGTTVLRHEVVGRPTFAGIFIWNAVIRWLHDAVLEELLDRAQVVVGDPTRPVRWSPVVKALRPVAARL